MPTNEGERVSRLAAALLDKDRATASRFLDEVQDVNEEVDRYGTSLLMLACCHGFIDVVKHLLQLGADPTRRDRRAYTAAHYAAERNHPAALTELIATLPATATASTLKGNTPLHVAALSGSCAAVETLIAATGATCVDRGNAEKCTPLACAAAKGRAEVVDLLLSKRARSDCRCVVRGYTALHWAIDGGSLECTTSLLATSRPSTVDDFGHTALHLAAARGDVHIAKAIVTSGGDVHTVDQGGNSPLHLAASKGHTGMVHYLLAIGAECDLANGRGQSAMHLGAAHGHTEVVKSLIDAGASVDVKDDLGTNPLHCAAAKGRVEMVELLLKHEANVEASTAAGHTVLDAAVLNGDPGTVSLIQRALTTSQRTSHQAIAQSKAGSAGTLRKQRNQESPSLRASFEAAPPLQSSPARKREARNQREDKLTYGALHHSPNRPESAWETMETLMKTGGRAPSRARRTEASRSGSAAPPAASPQGRAMRPRPSPSVSAQPTPRYSPAASGTGYTLARQPRHEMGVDGASGTFYQSWNPPRPLGGGSVSDPRNAIFHHSTETSTHHTPHTTHNNDYFGYYMSPSMHAVRPPMSPEGTRASARTRGDGPWHRGEATELHARTVAPTTPARHPSMRVQYGPDGRAVPPPPRAVARHLGLLPPDTEDVPHEAHHSVAASPVHTGHAWHGGMRGFDGGPLPHSEHDSRSMDAQGFWSRPAARDASPETTVPVLNPSGRLRDVYVRPSLAHDDARPGGAPSGDARMSAQPPDTIDRGDAVVRAFAHALAEETYQLRTMESHSAELQRTHETADLRRTLDDVKHDLSALAELTLRETFLNSSAQRPAMDLPLHATSNVATPPGPHQYATSIAMMPPASRVSSPENAGRVLSYMRDALHADFPDSNGARMSGV